MWTPQAKQVWKKIVNDEPLTRRLATDVISAGNVPGSSSPSGGTAGSASPVGLGPPAAPATADGSAGRRPGAGGRGSLRVSARTARPSAPETDWERRRRLAAVFGDVLPETTSDERDPESAPATAGEDAGEAWLQGAGPPHHG